MPDYGEATLVLHGLDSDNRVVRGDVFARKLGAFIAGLRAADRFANGALSFDYMIDDLSRRSSALATLREKRRTRKPALSSVAAYEEVAAAVYNGDVVAKRFPPTLIRHIGNLCSGATKKFSHAEVEFANDNVVRIDDFLGAQAVTAERQFFVDASSHSAQGSFAGVSHGSFDGTIEEIDARGTLFRGKLLPTGGAVEIDCVMNKDKIPEVAGKFHKRAYVSGLVHYSQDSAIPLRIDVSSIELLDERRQSDLIRWRGAFSGALASADEDEW
jgi:hypothetical protein